MIDQQKIDNVAQAIKDDIDKPLSANQGKLLNSFIDNLYNEKEGRNLNLINNYLDKGCE